MMQKCLEKIGKRCENWNFEGQWILQAPERKSLQSGMICPVVNASSNIRESIVNQVRFQLFRQTTYVNKILLIVE